MYKTLFNKFIKAVREFTLDIIFAVYLYGSNIWYPQFVRNCWSAAKETEMKRRKANNIKGVPPGHCW